MCVAFLEIFEMFFVNSKNSFWMLQTKKKKKNPTPKIVILIISISAAAPVITTQIKNTTTNNPKATFVSHSATPTKFNNSPDFKNQHYSSLLLNFT